MNQPFGSYRGLAAELMERAAETGFAGELIELIGLKGDEDLDAWFDDTDSAKAPHRRKRLLQAIIREIEVYRVRQVEPPLDQSATVVGRFLYAFADNATHPPERREWAARNRLLPTLRSLLYQLDDDEFERLCAHLLAAMGCTGVRITRENKDRGVDVLGRLPADAPAGRSASARMALRRLFLILVGQSKRYGLDNPIGPDEVRQIFGTWGLIMRARMNGELEQHIDCLITALGFRAEDPAVHMIFTSSRFTGPAEREAKGGGIVLLDGQQIAQLLAAEGLGMKRIATGNWSTQLAMLRRLCRTSPEQ